MTQYIKRESNLDKNCQKAYALIFVQCTEHMRSKLKAREYYHIVRGDYEVFLLVGSIKGLTFKLYFHKHPLHSLRVDKRDFY